MDFTLYCTSSDHCLGLFVVTEFFNLYIYQQSVHDVVSDTHVAVLTVKKIIVRLSK